MDRLVRIKSSKYGLEVYLDPETDFETLLVSIQTKFTDAAKFFRGAKMALTFSGRILTRPEEETILQMISDITDIDIVCIIDDNHTNEMTYKSIVDKSLEDRQKWDGKFYKGTLGKRQVLESDSSIVILGDVESGAKVIAKGNVVVIGSLHGSVHAGAAGDVHAFIAALSMQPTQLRIGDIEAKRQMIYQESTAIHGPKIAVVDGHRIYVDPLTD